MFFLTLTPRQLYTWWRNRAGIKEPQRWKYFVKGLRRTLQTYVIDKEPKTFAQAEQFAKKGEAINQINEQCDNDRLVAMAIALDKVKSSENSDKIDKMCAAVERLEQVNQGQVKGRSYGVRHPDTHDQRVCWFCGLKGHLKRNCRQRLAQPARYNNHSTPRTNRPHTGTMTRSYYQNEVPFPHQQSGPSQYYNYSGN